MIFLILSGKMIFPFPKNMTLIFRRYLHWNMIYLVLSGKEVFFSGKHDIFSLDGK